MRLIPIRQMTCVFCSGPVYCARRSTYLSVCNVLNLRIEVIKSMVAESVIISKTEMHMVTAVMSNKIFLSLLVRRDCSFCISVIVLRDKVFGCFLIRCIRLFVGRFVPSS